MKYQWEQCPNPQVNLLHVSIRLPRVCCHFGTIDTDDDARLSDDDRELVRQLLDIDGVETVSMDRYHAQFGKAHLVDWAPIRAEIIECFRKRFKPKGSLLQSGPPFGKAGPIEDE